MKRFRTEVVILDDGFQHLRLQRDLDLVLLDARRPFGNGFLLPRGTLREPLSALSRAHACLLTRCPRALIEKAAPHEDRKDGNRLVDIRQRSVFPASHAPFMAEWIAAGQTDWRQGTPPAEEMPVGPAYAFSGIARNDEFQTTLTDMGFHLTGGTAFPDHHTYTRKDLTAIETHAGRRGAQFMVTTEKDRVKIDASWIGRLPLLVVGVRMDLGVYAEPFQRFVACKLALPTAN